VFHRFESKGENGEKTARDLGHSSDGPRIAPLSTSAEIKRLMVGSVIKGLRGTSAFSASRAPNRNSNATGFNGNEIPRRNFRRKPVHVPISAFKPCGPRQSSGRGGNVAVAYAARCIQSRLSSATHDDCPIYPVPSGI